MTEKESHMFSLATLVQIVLSSLLIREAVRWAYDDVRGQFGTNTDPTTLKRNLILIGHIAGYIAAAYALVGILWGLFALATLVLQAIIALFAHVQWLLVATVTFPWAAF